MSFIKKLFGSEETSTQSPDYIEVDVGRETPRKSKVVLRPFVLKSFDDINGVLEILREGYTIAVIDIKPLKTKDIVELKRAIAKLKKTVDALEGTVAGFGENIIVASPSFVEVFRGGASAIKPADMSA
ncbi:cell division protein SepF [Candidatus Pacearchaeota archaeon]|nr:cell division protein SepF [Candidatus Pacearchaeota archaeon]